jgi:hypothetical protein
MHMAKKSIIFLLAIIWMITGTGNVNAQEYYFALPKLDVNVYWNADGSSSIDYTFYFQNEPSGHPIEFVDVGLPNNNVDEQNISADIEGQSLSYISKSEFQGIGSYGVAIGLGSYAIPPGSSGVVHVYISRVENALYPSEIENYASAVFFPAYFNRAIVSGTTDLTVTYHLPPGVQPDEPRWHSSPTGFPEQPITGFDDQDRITYIWRNQNANAYTPYEFGASFPVQYIPEETIVRPNPFAWLGNINFEAFIPCLCISSFLAIMSWAAFAGNKRKLQYLPPKISIEGHGIKRGLTAVEAAILMEQPLDKVLTMILFGIIKKNAASVIKREPLTLKINDPLPEGLHAYEIDFINSFRESGSGRKKKMQTMTIDLVKSVSNKMKGFSRGETINYYRDITRRAWSQVEAADTPEVKSQKYDEVMEWTMLDRDYDDRTREVFRNQPVYIPHWWGRYDPAFRPSAPAPKLSASPTGAKGAPSMPYLPGSDFAASVVNGVQGFSSKVVGNITEFTNGITELTNPLPKSTTSSSKSSWKSSGGGGGCACACACACAGCACACAGGGR